jgi:hypothetical protein
MATAQQLEIGTKVRYYPLLSNKDVFTDHEVQSECWDVCGEQVVKVTGKSGGVSIKHLDLI